MKTGAGATHEPEGTLPKSDSYNGCMLIFLLALTVSLVVTFFLVKAATRSSRWALDNNLSGPQKFHAHAVPRIGGIGIATGLVGASPLIWWVDENAGRLSAGLLLCGLPAFGAGLTEDFTGRVSPRLRLLATAVSAGLAFWFLGAAISRTDIPGLDWIASVAIGSAIITVFAVAGIANSVNIIDGFNGLASMCVVIMLSAVSYVAFNVGDAAIGSIALAGVGAVMGFFFWNFPAGLIFLGDGGAYFLGFLVAESSILLLVRNPEVSPLFPLLVCVYPIFETLFSIYRRRVLRSVPPSMPDGIHLHSLIYRRVMRWAVGDRSAKALTRRNSMTSPYLWLLCMLSAIPATLFWSNTLMLGIFLVLFGLTYLGLYWRIVRFRAPRLMHMFRSSVLQSVERDNRRS